LRMTRALVIYRKICTYENSKKIRCIYFEKKVMKAAWQYTYEVPTYVVPRMGDRLMRDLCAQCLHKKLRDLLLSQLRDLVVAVAKNRIVDILPLLVTRSPKCLSPPLHR
jgi:hypothetical protein